MQLKKAEFTEEEVDVDAVVDEVTAVAAEEMDVDVDVVRTLVSSRIEWAKVICIRVLVFSLCYGRDGYC